MSLRDAERRRVAKDAVGVEDTRAATAAAAGSGIQIPPLLN